MKYLLIFLLISTQTFGQKNIDTTEIIHIGGIKQFVRIKGKDASKPLLLFLHGGPGASLMAKTDGMTGKLQQQFVVVQWDQRETGETGRLNKTKQPLTLQMFYDDTHDLVDSLLRRFQQTKLFIVGYSWGTVLGFYMADQYPELLYAYIAVSPVIDQRRSDSISLAMLKKTIPEARRDLSKVKIPFENAEQLYYHRKWLFKHDGQKFIGIALRKSVVEAWGVTWFDMWSKACTINRFESLPAIRCPVYFFAGEKDYNTNYSITREYFNKVSAPKKDFFLFHNAGHGLPETDAESFQDVVIDLILPKMFNR